MVKELEDHTSHGHWIVVKKSAIPRHHLKRMLNMVWSMKRKLDPVGEIIKWKARLCAHGGMAEYWLH
jgi:hypothetical protein